MTIDGAAPPSASLTIGAAAALVGVSVSTLRAWEAAGLVAPERNGHGQRRYSRAEAQCLREIRQLRDQTRVPLKELRRLWAAQGQERSLPGLPVDATGRRIAARLRALRARLGLSVRQAAERTGLSASYVSSIENGYTRPSVAGLKKLADAYGVNILSFYEPSPEPRRRLVRRGAAETIAMGHPGVAVALLTPHQSAIELHLFELAPGADSGGSYCHEGDEFWYVLRGTLGVWLDGEPYRLEAGDCLAFASTDEHRFANLADDVTIFLGGNTPSTW